MIALISSKDNKSVILWEKLSENKMKFGPCKYSIKVIQTIAHSSKSLLCTSYCISHHLFNCTSIMQIMNVQFYLFIISLHEISSNNSPMYGFCFSSYGLPENCSNYSLSLSPKSSLVMNLKSSMVLQLSMDYNTLTTHYPQAWDEL